MLKDVCWIWRYIRFLAKKAGRLARAETDHKWFRSAWDVTKWRERGTILLLVVMRKK